MVSRGKAMELGATGHIVRRRLQLGRWTELQPGVYYLNVTPATWRTDVLASVLNTGLDAVASHRSAAIIHGLEGIYGRTVDVTVPYDNRPEPPGAVLHRTRRPTDAVTMDAIPVTDVARTVLDLAAMMPDRVLERVLASALRKKLITVDDMDSKIAGRGGRGVGGTRRARRVLKVVAADVSGSIAEVDMSRLIRSAAVPPPVPQLKIPLRDGANAYPDFAWADRKRIVEVDGLESHSNQRQLAHDLHRQNQLLELGWEMRRWPAQVVMREPQRVVEELARFVNAPFQPRSVESGRA